MRKGIFRIVRSDARTVACAGGDGSLSTWKLDPDRNKPLTQLRRIPLCDEKLRDIVVSEDGERLVVACGDAALRELDLPSMNERQRFDGHAKGANCVAFHPTKPVLISGGKDGQVKVWRTDGSCMHEFAAHKGSVYATRIDPTGQFLVSIGRDALVKIWDANSLEPVLRSTRERIAHIAFGECCAMVRERIDHRQRRPEYPGLADALIRPYEMRSTANARRSSEMNARLEISSSASRTTERRYATLVSGPRQVHSPSSSFALLISANESRISPRSFRYVLHFHLGDGRIDRRQFVAQGIDQFQQGGTCPEGHIEHFAMALRIFGFHGLQTRLAPRCRRT